MSLKNSIDKSNIPSHVAIIMDGNGRWAKSRGKERFFGHIQGVESVREAIEAAGEIGVKHLTLYAFSTENWSRPQEEVDALMNLLVDTIEAEQDSLMEKNVSLTSIGNIKGLPENCQLKLESIRKTTGKNTGLNVILALNYSAKWEILNAVNNIIKDTEEGEIKHPITEEEFNTYLQTDNIPNPELMIRTSGEQRMSNFLLWQLAYSELYFTDIFWPEFNREEFFKAILSYQRRESRFGKISEQIQTS